MTLIVTDADERTDMAQMLACTSTISREQTERGRRGVYRVDGDGAPFHEKNRGVVGKYAVYT